MQEEHVWFVGALKFRKCLTKNVDQSLVKQKCILTPTVNIQMLRSVQNFRTDFPSFTDFKVETKTNSSNLFLVIVTSS